MMLLLLLALLFDVCGLILRQINCLVFFCFLVVVVVVAVVAEIVFEVPSLISRQIGLSCCPRSRVYVCVVFLRPIPSICVSSLVFLSASCFLMTLSFFHFSFFQISFSSRVAQQFCN